MWVPKFCHFQFGQFIGSIVNHLTTQSPIFLKIHGFRGAHGTHANYASAMIFLAFDSLHQIIKSLARDWSYFVIYSLCPCKKIRVKIWNFIFHDMPVRTFFDTENHLIWSDNEFDFLFIFKILQCAMKSGCPNLNENLGWINKTEW